MMKNKFNIWMLSMSALLAATQLQATPLLEVKPEQLLAIDACVQKDRGCYRYQVVTLKTGQQWLDDYFEQQARTFLEPVYSDEIGEKELAQKRESLKKLTTQDLIKELLASFKPAFSGEYAPIGWETSYAPHFLGQRGNIAMFSEDFYIFTGGAHGIGSTNFTNFNLDTQKKLTIDDILEDGKKSDFVKLLQQAYINYLQGNGSSDTDAQARLSSSKDIFTESEFNFTFTYRGVLVKFAPYTLGSFAEGDIDLEVPYQDLVGIVKAPFLADTVKPLD